MHQTAVRNQSTEHDVVGERQKTFFHSALLAASALDSRVIDRTLTWLYPHLLRLVHKTCHGVVKTLIVSVIKISWSTTTADMQIFNLRHYSYVAHSLHTTSRRSGLQWTTIRVCSGLPVTVQMSFNATISPSFIRLTATSYLPRSNVNQPWKDNDFSRLASSNHDWSVPINIPQAYKHRTSGVLAYPVTLQSISLPV